MRHGVPVLPKDSFVIVSRISNSNDLFISMMSEIGGIALDVDGDIIINGGKNDGIVIVGKLLEKINQLEDKLKSHQHGYIPYPGGVAATPVSTTSAYALLPPDLTLQFPNTQQSEIENKKITH